MNPIQLAIQTGSTAGTRLSFDQPRVRFGRGPDNDLVIDNPAVSREHGELVFDNGTWSLVNLSSNGTKVGSSTIHKQTKLTGGEQVSVGGQPIFSVSIQAPAAETSSDDFFSDDEDKETDQKATSGKGRAKLWIGVAAYMVVMLVAGVLIYNVFDSPKNNGSQVTSTPLTKPQVEAAVKRDVEKANAPNTETVQDALGRARTAYQARENNPVKLFEAYEQYRRAIAYSSSDPLTPDDRLAYIQVMDELTETVWTKYDSAVTDLDANLYQSATTKFQNLMSIYTDSDSKVYKSVELLHKKASSMISD